jgi:hypothetical protein
MDAEIHRKRCKKCKAQINLLLQAGFGKAEAIKKLDISTSLSSYADSPYYVALKKIYKALQEYRGYENFVRSKKLKEVDFFVPSPGFILEFDERQHFTIPRKITLSLYPENIKIGFDKNLWMRLCEELHEKDNDPKFRDEQRAWYDTLRDFAPYILPELQMEPTKRIIDADQKIKNMTGANYFEWCSFDPLDPDEVVKFSRLISQ